MHFCECLCTFKSEKIEPTGNFLDWVFLVKLVRYLKLSCFLIWNFYWNRRDYFNFILTSPWMMEDTISFCHHLREVLSFLYCRPSVELTCLLTPCVFKSLNLSYSYVLVLYAFQKCNIFTHWFFCYFINHVILNDNFPEDIILLCDQNTPFLFKSFGKNRKEVC